MAQPSPNTDTITISREEYLTLKEDANFLACLEAVGVDNWEGYSEAAEMFNSDS
jgi:hypothetical protein